MLPHPRSREDMQMRRTRLNALPSIIRGYGSCTVPNQYLFRFSISETSSE